MMVCLPQLVMMACKIEDKIAKYWTPAQLKKGLLMCFDTQLCQNIVTEIVQKKQNCVEILKSWFEKVIMEQSVKFRQKSPPPPQNVLKKSLSDRRGQW